MTSSVVIAKIAPMLQGLLLKQKQQIDYFYTYLDVAVCEELLYELVKCQGVLFFTGIGKSGFIAQKIAATMLSTGNKAFFLPPIDALHGDLGMVSKKDAVIILSKSGETEELLQLLPFIRNKGAKILGITSNKESRLARGSDHIVILPCENELCPFDLAPTTSTEVQLLFGDVLAIALMEIRGFSLSQFAENHPGGRIGRRSSMCVRDLMLDKESSPLCLSEDRLEEVLIDFTNKRCGCLIIIDEKRQLKGIFTDGDLRRALQAKGEKILKEKVGELMTRTPKAIKAAALAWDAMKLMESDQKHPVMVLPVLDDKDEVIGIIKMHDLIQAGL
ncbi:MAG TPA: KpsF/GutQ family sugar-phosphate isomerase [Waddliaceae bacterium]